jgi:transposase
MNKTVQEEVLNEKGYSELNADEDGKFRYKVIEKYVHHMTDEDGNNYEEEVNLICFWSEKMAERDRTERSRMIEKAKECLENNPTINDKRGSRRYLKTVGEKQIVGIDEERIKQDSLYDGYYVIESSRKTLSAEEVISSYKQLWQIEESFRIMKSSLWSCPIFHWTPNRIRGHFVLCYMALLLERILEQELRKKNIEASAQRIKSALNSLQVSLINIDGEDYYLRGKSEELANNILKAIGIKQPKDLTTTKDFQIIYKK